ncbi:NAD(P)H-dependent FMN reductase [Arenibacter nanhaiticus]|uniref:NAD(P)H-dependent FMN reductase n=1 Tax=Arenibacter nanhaiticus TaxID=558155 RepID=A0A1M6FMW6_9FLAO|nr:NAD(P)H-dependent oxidoreductase [Arenibacter nanhaiticus]SHI99098.1 NAD(P)H-dependent FMN reductase [Arenibacter nanhaiticus]
MANIVAFAGSNSSTSINYQLTRYTVSLVGEHKSRLLNMVDYNLPMFSEDLEREKGYSDVLIDLMEQIKLADGLIISVNEHNSSPSAYFKNVIDWLSRLNKDFLLHKKVLLMSTSRGKRGGSSSLGIIKAILPRFGADVVATFSLPSFNHTFNEAKGVTDAELSEEHKKALELFLSKI